MYLVYSFLLTLGFVLLLPRFAIDALRNGKYVTGLRQRLGDIPPIKSDGRPTIWLHCVSVGEAQAALSLVRRLKETFPNHTLVISTTTVTGQRLAQTIFKEQAAAIFYFPIDWTWTVRRVLRQINPAAIFIMETELWPNLFHAARQRNTPIVLLNGRISDKSFRRYRRIRPFISRVLNDLTLATMQSEQDAMRIRELGLANERIVAVGNLKFDNTGTAADDKLTTQIRERFSFADDRPLFVAASTHAPEEAVVLNAFRLVRQSHANLRLLLAPRHPERFAEVAALLSASEFSVARGSAPAAKDDELADIILLDSIGELSAVFPLARIAFIGGSIAPHGGHNVIEPATHGLCTITGPHTSNFAAITKAMLAEGALVQLSDTRESTTELAQTLKELLSDEQRRTAIGKRARTVCETNRGATTRTLELLCPLVDMRPAEPYEERRRTVQTATAK
jgi:3-deoxy-D-manno-octulosonic-acid transferase